MHTPSKKAPLEGHFGDRSRGFMPISRPIARCCTIAAMRRHENSDLQALQRWLGALAIASLPSVATAGVAGRPDTAQLLAAVCVGALIVLVAVAVAQRRRNPPTTTTTSPAEARSAQPVASGATASRITELQTTLDARERELADRTRELAGRLRELDNAGRELDSLAHSVSHDLRAPLRVVDGFATIVLEDYGDRGKPLDDLGRDHLRRIVAASQRMNSMIDMLLNLSRMTSRELASERVDLSQIARELSDDLRDDIRAREPARSIEFVIAPGLRVDGDPTLLRLVLQNLLGNAAKFTAKSRDARVEVGCKEEGGSTEFFVRDNGAGFDMRFAEKMFGMFQRLHSANEFPGTGVGLATVQKIIQRHGGRVWAEAIPAPTEGHGATFHFTLWEKGT
jgi:signal transduction histidine kinase